MTLVYCMSGLSGLVDIHALVKTKQLIKPVPSWITDEYRTAKCMRRQYEHTWRRDKSPENCGDGKKFWQALNRILSWSNATVLPSFDDEKSLANRFGSFFTDKIKKITDTFKHTNLSLFILTRNRQFSVFFSRY